MENVKKKKKKKKKLTIFFDKKPHSFYKVEKHWVGDSYKKNVDCIFD